MPAHRGRALKRTCWGVLLTFLIGGIVDCQLTITEPNPSVVDAKVGRNVTLLVEYSGAVEPALVWLKDGSPIVTWAIGSSDPPQISPGSDTLRVESNGSLTIQNVQLEDAGGYTVRLVKAGVGSDTATLTLRVFDDIEGVSVSSAPATVKEGVDALRLTYSTARGEAESVKWFFNGEEIKNGSRHVIGDKSLTVKNPTRADTGLYTLGLTNPFSSATVEKNVTVFYGPDEPVLGVSPQKPAFESGESLSLSCAADGDPAPSVSWVFGGVTLPTSQGTLNLSSVLTTQSGVYTCVLVNAETGDRQEKNFTINVYERPPGSLKCSVGGNATEDLQYRCQWPGGAPEAELSFPALNDSLSGHGDFNLTVTPTQDLSGREITCIAQHPLLQRNCSVTARGPAGLVPRVTAMVAANGTLVTTIACASTSMPVAAVTWSRGGQVISSGGRYWISDDTTVLSIVDPALDTSDMGVYVCDAANPLGRQESSVRLLGPKISKSSLSANEDGTVVTLTWETPAASIVTGFRVQMTGPDLKPRSGGSQRTRRATDEFRTVQTTPASVRSTALGTLDPGASYRFRVVPVAGGTAGDPSQEHRAGPGGLSEAAIAGIAAGVPCGLLLLVLLILLIICCARKRKRRATRYPVSRTVDKVGSSQLNLSAPHKLLTGGLKRVGGPPAYDNHQISSERSTTLPSEALPPPVRMATTV